MEGLDAGDFLEGRAVGWDEADETNACEALEHPAHGWAVCGVLELVGDGLTGRGAR